MNEIITIVGAIDDVGAGTTWLPVAYVLSILIGAACGFYHNYKD